MKMKGPPHRVTKDFETPTADEIEAHNATHIPANMCCPACDEGKTANQPHRRIKDQCRHVPEVGLDYAFMQNAEGGRTVGHTRYERQTRSPYSASNSRNKEQSSW